MNFPTAPGAREDLTLRARGCELPHASLSPAAPAADMILPYPSHSRHPVPRAPRCCLLFPATILGMRSIVLFPILCVPTPILRWPGGNVTPTHRLAWPSKEA